MKVLVNPKAVIGCLMVFLLVLVVAGTTLAGNEATETRAWLGVQLQALNDDLRDALDLDEDIEGVLVAEVLEDSPAEEAGLEDGDVIISLDGEDMASVGDLVQAINDHSPGDKVRIAVIRDGRRATITAELGERKRKKYRVRDIHMPDLGHLENLGKDVHRWVEAWHGDQGYLGVSILDINDELGEYFKVKEGEGVLITDVLEDSPAEDAGLKAGDVVLEFDGKMVGDTDKFRKYVAKSEPGEDVSIVVKRKGRKKTFEVEIGEMESPMGHFMESYSFPPGKRSGRIVVRDDDGEVEVYGLPGGRGPGVYKWDDDDFEWFGKKGCTIHISDPDDLEELEELGEVYGIIGIEDREEIKEEIENLKKEMEKLRKEMEKLK